MADHECPAPGCEKRVPYTQLACAAHWYALPMRIRDAVYEGWRWRSADDGAAHTAAVRDALGYWHRTAVNA